MFSSRKLERRIFALEEKVARLEGEAAVVADRMTMRWIQAPSSSYPEQNLYALKPPERRIGLVIDKLLRHLNLEIRVINERETIEIQEVSF